MTRLWNLTIRIGKALWLSEPYFVGALLKGGGEEGLPCLFRKYDKSALILGKTLIVVICRLNFLFKVQFFRVSRRKNGRRVPEGLFFLLL